jgi:Phospholipase_D-nuclease N-terminal
VGIPSQTLGWVVFIIVLPFLGVLCYLIAYSAGIAERRA